MRVSGLLVILAIAAACGGATTTDAHPQPAAAVPQAPSAERPTGTAGARRTMASPEAGDALADFKRRVDAYAELHKELAKGSAKLRETADPAKINNAQAALAAKVQAARSQAKQGDIFTPAVRPIFRRLLAPELKGVEGRDTKAVLEDDDPAPGTVRFKVNAKYPDAQPLPTVPANVLATLPELPAPLEYRIVGQHLLLLDTASDLIADYMLNAIRK
jgi:hypothetical protein